MSVRQRFRPVQTTRRAQSGCEFANSGDGLRNIFIVGEASRANRAVLADPSCFVDVNPETQTIIHRSMCGAGALDPDSETRSDVRIPQLELDAFGTDTRDPVAPQTLVPPPLRTQK